MYAVEEATRVQDNSRRMAPQLLTHEGDRVRLRGRKHRGVPTALQRQRHSAQCRRKRRRLEDPHNLAALCHSKPWPWASASPMGGTVKPRSDAWAKTGEVAEKLWEQWSQWGGDKATLAILVQSQRKQTTNVWAGACLLISLKYEGSAKRSLVPIVVSGVLLLTMVWSRKESMGPMQQERSHQRTEGCMPGTRTGGGEHATTARRLKFDAEGLTVWRSRTGERRGWPAMTEAAHLPCQARLCLRRCYRLPQSCAAV
mmetsp:Transcript_62281/g.117191  ORF Transcript_62281/g.117191 Transcript_62281/m.117191 type:complete len:256 (-) Transcript_62281:521-1288(-)